MELSAVIELDSALPSELPVARRIDARASRFFLLFQIFSEVSVMFSIGGKYYTGDPIVYSYMEDRIFENSRNISIKLHHRIGRFVKLRFSFASRWIMISEVTFDSGE